MFVLLFAVKDFVCLPRLQGIIHAARLRNLRSGHSHEDVDQAFGLLASHLAKRARKAVGPPEFRTIIQDWLDGATRVHEKGRYAVQVDQCRDWWFACK